MAKYLVKVSYTLEGVRGVAKEGGTARREVASTLIAAAGGTMESFHFAFGSDDVIVIADLPDNVAATALALTVSASGGAHTSVTPLITPEEVDQAVKMHPDYRAPGS